MSIPYVDYGGTQMLRPPYVAEDVGYYGFLVHADMGALTKLIDERLNRPMGGATRFEPAGPFVMFVYVKLGKMYSQNPPDRDKGWFHEQEFAVWVRVIDRVSKRAFWFHPYMLVDNSYAMVLGREVYGFPKAWGWLDIPADPTQASACSVETLLIPVFNPNSEAVRKPLVRATRVSGGEDIPKMILDGAEFVAEVMNLLGPDDTFLEKLEELANAFRDVVHRSEPFAFLKQFAAADAAGVACYQAIVESADNATALHRACVLSGTWQIEITAADSHPIARDLGLASNTIQAAVPFYVNFDMVVGFGKNIYTAKSGEDRPKKIAILGGGVGAMATALQLISEPDWQSHYDITIYQMGWRLGGKGASGRGESDRIEEHGLHIWMGFYENAFRIMRQVYEENKANRPVGSPLRDWTEAFHEHSYVALMDRASPESEWQVWPVVFPTADGTPGDGSPITFWDALVHLIKWLQQIYLESDFHKAGAAPPDGNFLDSVHNFFAGSGRGVPPAEDLVLRGKIEGVRLGAELLAAHPSLRPEKQPLLAALMKDFRDSLRGNAAAATLDVNLHEAYEVIDLGATVVKGLLEGGYLEDHNMLDGLHEEFLEWLKKEGADQALCSTRNSAVLRGLYDLVFAYRNGDESNPSFEAGVAIRCILLIVGAYKGAIFWKMQAGMGDVVFGPMYQVLKDKVKFEFFHRVEELVLSGDGSSVDSIRLGVQATLKEPAKGYQPLMDCKGLPSWPATPLYDQLVEGEQLQKEKANLESFWCTWKNPATKTLQAGQDFDQVVLGISLGGLPFLFAQNAPVPEAMRLMMQNVETVRTQAFQLWVNKTFLQLGWTSGGVVMDAYTDPLNTWATMDQLIDRESWPPDTVKGIHYFCGSMVGGIPPRSENNAPELAHDQVQANAENFIKNDLPRLLPNMKDPDFRILSEYFRANINPTERYVQTVAGSTPYRLRANESGLTNVVLAGDWTRNGFNAGCVEAAVMSGIHAANAIAGRPLDEGVDGPLRPWPKEKAATAGSGS